MSDTFPECLTSMAVFGFAQMSYTQESVGHRRLRIVLRRATASSYSPPVLGGVPEGGGGSSLSSVPCLW